MNKTLPILTALFTVSTFAQAAPQTLDVYTYDSVLIGALDQKLKQLLNNNSRNVS